MTSTTIFAMPHEMDPAFPARWRRIEKLFAITLAVEVLGVVQFWFTATRTLWLLMVGSMVLTALSMSFLVWFIRRAIRRHGVIYPP